MANGVQLVALAQANTIGCLRKCGAPESQILSLDHDLPMTQHELRAVATDDVLLFHRCKKQGRKTLQRLDHVFAEHGIVRNKAKDVNLAGHTTGLGCDIVSSPPMVEPALHKIANVVLGKCDLLVSKRASPAIVNSLLGVLKWFCLLQRNMFSIFDAVYDFVKHPDSSEEPEVPEKVRSEFLVALALLPLLPASLDRDFLPELLACDAAADFGFGVCSLNCGRSVTQKVGRLAERRGDFVRLFPDEGDEPEVARLGTPHRLQFSKGDFKTIISSRVRFSAHSGLLECHGVLLALKWVSRSHSRHSSRPVILVDAKAAIGCISKGRSSARALRRVLRSTAALYVWLATFYQGWFTLHQSQTQQMPLHVVADGMFARVIGARGAEAVCQCEVFIWFVYLTSNSESCRAWPLSPFLRQTGLIATIGGTSPLLASTGL